MKAYRAGDVEAAHTRDLLKDWAGEGWITATQREQMERETDCRLRRTNVFLRMVLFFFTQIIVGAAVGLFFTLFFSGASSVATGVALLLLAAACYGAAELAVAEGLLYRHGIEEALACGAVLLLAVGLQSLLPRQLDFLMPAAGAAAAWWLWRRFGFWYALPAAMVYVIWLPGYWTRSPGAQHLAVAALYAAGLLLTRGAREHAMAEAFLWLGVYCALNLPLSTMDILRPWIGGVASGGEAIPRPLYWFTWVLIWCLPPAILARGVRAKNRAVIAVGLVTAILTLAANKAYLGWPRHTWDPMLLGVILAGAALWLRRWLDSAPDGVRSGFTARRLSGKDQRLIDAGGTVMSLAAPALTPTPAMPASTDGPRFGGGQSGGGGASSDF